MSGNLNQVEHEQISTSLEVEQIEVNLFRSKSLWVPIRGRGVFGGQVISQALVSATNCVDSAFALHSLHCYFISSASTKPIIYSVERLRNGKSYVTRSVKAIQNGQVIFIMLCSFQKPEPWQPVHQWTMPQVPPPEQCEDEETTYARAIQTHKSNPNLIDFFQEQIDERARSPIAIKQAKMHHISQDGTVRYMYWMKARDIPKYEAHYQKCILAYISDLHFISTASLIMGLKRGKGQDALRMISTLDHTIWYYSDDFDAGDWLLYEVDCPRAGSGRSIVHGRMFTHDGKLVAVTSQEGVLRTGARGPSEENQVQPKL